ncbi:MAG: tRNA guanosine(34) transglycosylase Tgt [Spirochaetia bacterium]|jgi:queuine tRNA-ribosyltransferase|nr:tRNA guanosine(34) transglycosylase Tgt [Spirochaetia bacterium]
MIFKTTHKDKDTHARTGILTLPKGNVITPAFMPVGTNGTVKAIHHETVDNMGYNLILGNTYHLYLRPGLEVIKHYGSLHKFSNWKHNILTDSGGFQIFSLATFRKIREEGVRFRSHIDGAYHNLSPEDVVMVQESLGSDIQMCLDVCTPPDISYKKALEASDITTRWAGRAKKRWLESDENYHGKLFGIMQGNFYKDLRKKSAEEILSLDLPGIAIGGLSVGESYEKFIEFLSYSAELLPDSKPAYLMGIGTPDYILEAVENGIDLFDCVYATRIARNGTVFTKNGLVALKKAIHAMDDNPIEKDCTCRACTQYSRGYLRHLFKSNEILGPMLATEHNLNFLYTFVEDIRTNILKNTFREFKTEFLSKYTSKKS